MKPLFRRHIFFAFPYLLLFTSCECVIAQVKFNSTFSTFFDWCYSVQQTNDSGYIVSGVSYPPGSCCVDVSLIKYNYSGDTLWSSYIGGAGWDGGYSVTETSDSGFVIVGRTESF